MTPRWSHLLIVAAIVGAYALGRHTARPAEETHEEVREDQIAVTTNETTEAEEIAEHAVTEEATERTEATTERIRIVYRERIVQADGATEEREVELDAETARLLHEVEARREEVATLRALLASERSSAALIQASLDLRRELRPSLPNWRVGGLVGVDLGGLSPTYGGQVERRIIGPVYVGAWGLSSGQGGLSVGVEF